MQSKEGHLACRMPSRLCASLWKCGARICCTLLWVLCSEPLLLFCWGIWSVPEVDSGLKGDNELVHMALLLVGQLHVLWSLKVAGTVEFGVGGDGASVVLEAIDTLVLDGRVKLLPMSGAIVVPVCVESAR